MVRRSFEAVAAVCPAMDLAASADALHEPANRIYECYFLMQLFRRIRVKAKLFPKDFDRSRLRGVSSLRLFDDRITAYYCGFTGSRRLLCARGGVQRRGPHRCPGPDHSCGERSVYSRCGRETLRKIAANPNHHLHRNRGRRALRLYR